MIRTSLHGLSTDDAAWHIQIQGLVQGVGFRPAVWALAQRYHLRGRVLNNGQGVQIMVAGKSPDMMSFVKELTNHPPPLAKISHVEWQPISTYAIPEREFLIANTENTEKATGIIPDAATCSACLKEIFDPYVRHFRYPFTNCTHCGPRLTIQRQIPYDRSHTSMAPFPFCDVCAHEYADPHTRRFHAESIACYACGPKVWLERADQKPIAIDSFSMLDEMDAVCTLLKRGHIVAIKGLGGFQLACDATQEEPVSRLRTLKQRERKPFALMARDLDVIRRYCTVNDQEAALLQRPAAPIVLLSSVSHDSLAPSVAPNVNMYGFMLPNSPLHHLILKRMNGPIVLTSGNRAGEPQWIDNELAKEHLGHIAEYFVLHDREITQRVDDSVVKIMLNVPRIFRRSRGYAPTPITLPQSFGQAPRILAMGGELKNTFCFLKNGEALLSHHIGDLEDALTYADYQLALAQYQGLFGLTPEVVAIDRHPEYLSSKLGRELADHHKLPMSEVQHHHAHLAACLADNDIPLNTSPILGVLLDGLGVGEDGTFWGGEFLAGDYCDFTRLGTFKPIAMLGGNQASREPWRNTYAHVVAEMGWAQFKMNYHELPLFHYLQQKPRAILDQMLSEQVNSPLASSCGRLFDAVAAALGICQDRVLYEGQAAMELEAMVDRTALETEHRALAYPFSIPRLQHSQLRYVEPLAMWEALLGDLLLDTPRPVMAARFHKGLANVICSMVKVCSQTSEGQCAYQTVALSGGVFQNKILFELVHQQLCDDGFSVLSHRQVPMNDGGLALGQAAIAAARVLTHYQVH
ncbi:MAG: carbamoyltransferase HypF [Nitrospirales bacterium]|nr:MAG: carbamoyltransferase HypF [Nitrospirales bacterium]